jgi:hypothetical protein
MPAGTSVASRSTPGPECMSHVAGQSVEVNASVTSSDAGSVTNAGDPGRNSEHQARSARIVPGVRQGEAARVPQHVRMDWKRHASAIAEARDQRVKALGRHRAAALGSKYIGSGGCSRCMRRKARSARIPGRPSPYRYPGLHRLTRPRLRRRKQRSATWRVSSRQSRRRSAPCTSKKSPEARYMFGKSWRA